MNWFKSNVLQKSLTLAGMAAIPAFFLPFAWDVSPLSVVLEFLDTIADSSLAEIVVDGVDGLLLPAAITALSLPITLGWLWQLGGHAMTSRRAILAWSVFGVCWLPLSVVWLIALGHEQQQFFASAMWYLTVTVLLLWLVIPFLVIRQLRVARASAPLLAMQCVYVANVFPFLVEFFDGLAIGGWLTLLAALAYTAQIGHSVRSRKRTVAAS